VASRDDAVPPSLAMLVDFHNHVLPAVDDGARDAGETRAALLSMYRAGVHLVIATPHVQASALNDTPDAVGYRARIDAGYELARRIAESETPDLTLLLGAEILLDDPALVLPRTGVQLAGTDFILVEFSLYGVPPNAGDMLFRLRAQGWRPVLGHPERYSGLGTELLRSWRAMGTLLQVNAGSLLGDYGPHARKRAWDLLRSGTVDYICGDYHARGSYRVPAALDALARRGGRRQREILVANGGRLGRGEDPQAVPPLSGGSWLRRLFARR
jgi:protein-tyrosine phosphatase